MVEITTVKTAKLSTIAVEHNSDKVEITSDYDTKKWGFSPGDFVELIGTGRADILGICVGVGKGCYIEPKRNQLWFLFERKKGISHLCGAHQAYDFARKGLILSPKE